MKRLPALLVAVLLALSSCSRTNPPNPATSPNPTPNSGNKVGDTVPGPVPGTRITEAYARLVARDAYFWAWPMVNIYNRRLAFAKAPQPGIMNDLRLLH